MEVSKSRWSDNNPTSAVQSESKPESASAGVVSFCLESESMKYDRSPTPTGVSDFATFRTDVTSERLVGSEQRGLCSTRLDQGNMMSPVTYVLIRATCRQVIHNKVCLGRCRSCSRKQSRSQSRFYKPGVGVGVGVAGNESITQPWTRQQYRIYDLRSVSQKIITVYDYFLRFFFTCPATTHPPVFVKNNRNRWLFFGETGLWSEKSKV